MNDYLRAEIIEAATATNVFISELPFDEAEELRRQLIMKYAAGRADTPLWEYMEDAVAVQDVDGWLRIGEYTQGKECIMFFNEYDDPAMFRFDDGSEIVLILGETFHFEFYLTNIATDYLLCFNHHDFLIAAGSAKGWLA